MKNVLQALKGSKLLAIGQNEHGREIRHYLLPDGRVLELVRAAKKGS
jgi:hypothetical protein